MIIYQKRDTYKLQSFNMVNRAVPLSDQCDYLPGLSIGISTANMKFVDYPVVDKVPARTEVL
jgi:hypothetical protein